ncbi:histidinol dehydrogenase [bacterium]|nr:histidinol dehydrogenase [bacterium]
MRILSADDKGFQDALDEFKDRISFDDEAVNNIVKDIILNIKKNGDVSLLEYTKRFDGADLEKAELIVKPEEIERAYGQVTREGMDALRYAMENIEAFHRRQSRNTWIQPDSNGNILGQMINPIERVGIYVPGGKAPYPSTVLMCAIPAKIAGVKEIYCVSPPQADKGLNPYILVAADMSKVDRIFKTGGAQAVAALSYGTETIPKVDKIVGPGNIYVTVAKKQVFGAVDIDMLAGPSEILIVADDSAPARFIAADLLSQAEHDERASSILVTPSRELLNEVEKEIELQIEKLERRKICRSSLEKYGLMVLVKDIGQAVDIANRLSPEHLEMAVQDPFQWLSKVRNAGSVFLGYYTPEPVGDYIAGPNHVLPTGGTARFFSALGVDDFVKRSGISYYSKAGLRQIGEKAIILAEIEGLSAHACSIKQRFTQ